MIIEATEETPKIILDINSGSMEFTNRSLPEDAVAFYQPVVEWIKTYSVNPSPETICTVKLEYYNTSSAKQLYKIFNLLEELSKKSNVEVRWYYQPEDKDMQASGDRYSKMLTIPFKVMEC